MPRSAASQRSLLLFTLAAALLPVLTFYVIALRYSTDIPHYDDYDAILGFSNAIAASHSLTSRFLTALTWQHTNYKLIFENLIVLADLELTGHLNFILLQQIGNAFALGVAIVLWKLLAHPTAPLANVVRQHRLLLFLPVLFLFFAPRYVEVIDFANAGLLYLPAIFFTLLSLLLLARHTSSRSFALACLALILAIASSANGFFAALTGGLLLLQQRRFPRLALWSAVSLVLVLLYLFHYRAYTAVHPPQPPAANLLALVFYPFVFLGALMPTLPSALLLGLTFVLLFAYLFRQGWRRLDPATFYAAVFILITSAAVGILRHPLGLPTAIASRYSMYSILLGILLYLGVLRLKPLAGLSFRRAFLAFTLIACLYCAKNDWIEYKVLRQRRLHLIQHLQAWQLDPTRASLVPNEEPGMRTPAMLPFSSHAAHILEQSIRLGIYTPPQPSTLTTDN